MSKHLYILILGLFIITLPSCSSTESYEEEIKQLISEVEAGFEEHNGKYLKGVIAENYSDENNGTKKDIDGLITYYLFRHKNIHLLSHVTEIAYSEQGSSNITVYAAMAGRAGAFKDLLSSLQADVYVFNFKIQKIKGDWQLISAAWERATQDDISILVDSLNK